MGTFYYYFCFEESMLRSLNKLKCLSNHCNKKSLDNVACTFTRINNNNNNNIKNAKTFQKTNQISTHSKAGKVFEFRTYECQPAKMADFIALTNEKIFLRTNHSKLVGYWNVEFGAINGVQHIWEYDSFEQRASVRQTLAKDKTWNDQYFSIVKPWWQKQNTFVMHQVPWFDQQAPSKENGVYEIIQAKVLRCDMTKWATRFQHLIEHTSSKAEPIAIYYTDSGAVGSVIQIWRYDSFDVRTEAHEENIANRMWQTYAKDCNLITLWETSSLNTPLPFSPLK